MEELFASYDNKVHKLNYIVEKNDESLKLKIIITLGYVKCYEQLNIQLPKYLEQNSKIVTSHECEGHKPIFDITIMTKECKEQENKIINDTLIVVKNSIIIAHNKQIKADSIAKSNANAQFMDGILTTLFVLLVLFLLFLVIVAIFEIFGIHL